MILRESDYKAKAELIIIVMWPDRIGNRIANASRMHVMNCKFFK
jgi:hypothetical protein